MRNHVGWIPIALALLACTAGIEPAAAEKLFPFIMPEQRTIRVRDPSELPRARIPQVPKPPTVTDPQFDLPPRNLTLNDAINTGLANSEVVRVLAGVTAVSSGSTVYDVAITNTQIDDANARFDPSAVVNNTWSRNKPPGAIFDPIDPTRSLIVGTRTDNYNLNFGLTKPTSTGGTIDFGVDSDTSRFRPGIFPLNPQFRTSLDLAFTQPLLQGGGIAVNRVPIVVARIDTERSYFQFKGSVQESVNGMIEAYWALVFARTDLWAREQQVAQAAFANTRTEEQLEVGDANAGDVAQTRLALENFRVNVLDAKSNVLAREAALRNILGLPPYDSTRIVPVTPPNTELLRVDWDRVVALAEQRRPDIIELKLILEADQQLLLQSRNNATPRLDAVGLYRWNGLEGTMPDGMNIASRPGEFDDWTLGVNFSVPIGLRRERALLRRQELLIARDRANLDQGLHQTLYALAQTLRNLDLSYQRYLGLRKVRAAAQVNLDQQMARYDLGIVQFIIVLQAIVDWGNSVSSEAAALAQYNTDLANLERETGTILEANDIAFYEERFGSLGPLGVFGHDHWYPESTHPTPSVDRYPGGDRPSEETFDLKDPLEALDRDDDDDDVEEIPPPLQDSLPDPSPRASFLDRVMGRLKSAMGRK
jgi:outer membrane protein TolC